MPDSPDIAVIGMSLRVPGADTLEGFWSNLAGGVESITFFTRDELLAEGIDPKYIDNPNYVRAAPILDKVGRFDADLFGVSPGEAAAMDPQHRIMLECAWEALEHAGYDPERYEGLIGVYAGAAMNTYSLFSNLVKDMVEDYVAARVACDKDFLTTRISYKLNLKGPSLAVQTSCSTSLVTVHLACQALLDEECDMALAGGVSVQVPHRAGYFYREEEIFSPDGHCRAFDAQAQGTNFGSGAGIVALKRLDDALRDGDFIHAVIKGTAINNDGASKVSYAAPSAQGQAEVIAEALGAAGVSADTIGYVEAHGTGTLLGDPIEVAGLTQAFSLETDRRQFCALGSVKTNIGHLDTAAGVVSLIKTVLALQHKKIPPSLHFRQPNPQIDFENSPFFVNAELRNWDTNGVPRRAGVTSLGVGGTNAHAIVEEAPAPQDARDRDQPWHALVLSANSRSALDTYTQKLAAYLEQDDERRLSDVAYTLQAGRKPLKYRRCVVGRDGADAARRLRSAVGTPARCAAATKPPVVFMFPGQGAQFAGMGAVLYERYEVFRQEFDRCAEILQPDLQRDLRDAVLARDGGDGALDQTAITQPALFAVEYATARLYMAHGIEPESMIGHSVGEYVAATLAQVMSPEDALQLIAKRGALMQQCEPGGMLAVRLGAGEVHDLLAQELFLASDNAPRSCVVAGTVEAIRSAERSLSERGIGCARLRTSHAFHCPLMNTAATALEGLVRHMALNAPRIPYISNLTGTWILPEEATDPGYYRRHLLNTVRFNAGVTELAGHPERIFLEAGPGHSLAALVHAQPVADSEDPKIVMAGLPSDDVDDGAVHCFLESLGGMWLRGVDPVWMRGESRRLPVPTYPFEGNRFWSATPELIRGSRHPPASLRPIEDAPEMPAVADLAEGLRGCFKDLSRPYQDYPEAVRSLDDLCTAYIARFLEPAMGGKGELFTTARAAETLGILSFYRPLLERMLDFLSMAGRLDKTTSGWRAIDVRPLDPATIARDIRGRYTLPLPELDLLERCGEVLRDVLTGGLDPLDVLFPAGLDDVATPFFRDASWARALNGLVSATVEQCAEASPGRRLSIIEIGAGTGSTTRSILDSVPNESLEYLFTDISPSLTENARQQFKDRPSLTCRTLDIEMDLRRQGIEPRTFDIVIANNVLHATDDLRASVRRCRELLKPQGTLLLIEATTPMTWIDLTFGLTDGWWRFRDFDLRPHYPLLDHERWHDLLRHTGFTKTVSIPGPGADDLFGQSVLAGSARAELGKPAPQPLSAVDEGGFYIPSWKRIAAARARSFSHWVLFTAPDGPGPALAEYLRDEGHVVVEVRAGAEFKRDGDTFYINPENHEDYRRVFEPIRESAPASAPVVVHLWCVSDVLAPAGITHIDDALAKGFHSIIHTVRAITDSDLADVSMRVVASDGCDISGAERTDPVNAMLYGECKVIAREFPGIDCRAIDVSSAELGDLRSEDLAGLVKSISGVSTHKQVALRKNHLWTPTYEPLDVEQPPRSGIRDDGVFLITGGLGGIGLAVAARLVCDHRARVALVGRSSFPAKEQWDAWIQDHSPEDSVSRRISALRAMESRGGEVIVLQADVSDPVATRRAIEHTEQRFGPIHGVVHAAGIVADGAMALQSKEESEGVLSPKVHGTVVLYDLFKDRPLDFLLLMSSLGSITGNFGQAALTAANCFMDAFAQGHGDAPCRLRAVNWPAWRDTGAAALGDGNRSADASAIDVSQGTRALELILAMEEPQLIFSPVPLQLALAESDVTGAQEDAAAIGTDQDTKESRVDDPVTAVASIWSDVLGVPSVRDTDTFIGIGGDSLAAIRVAAGIWDRFRVRVSLQDLIEGGTVKEVVELIEARRQKDSAAMSNNDSTDPSIMEHECGGSIADSTRTGT